MQADLKAIRDGWDPGDQHTKNTNAKRDPAKVRKLADKYVSAHSDVFKGWDALPIEVCVQMVDKYRADGDEEKQWQVEAWLLHHFEPQNIGGTYEATVRITNGR